MFFVKVKFVVIGIASPLTTEDEQLQYSNISGCLKAWHCVPVPTQRRLVECQTGSTLEVDSIQHDTDTVYLIYSIFILIRGPLNSLKILVNPKHILGTKQFSNPIPVTKESTYC